VDLLEHVQRRATRIINDPRDGIASLRRQAERTGAVHPGEKKALRRSDSGLSVSKGELQERRVQTL